MIVQRKTTFVIRTPKVIAKILTRLIEEQAEQSLLQMASDRLIATGKCPRAERRRAEAAERRQPCRRGVTIPYYNTETKTICTRDLPCRGRHCPSCGPVYFWNWIDHVATCFELARAVYILDIKHNRGDRPDLDANGDPVPHRKCPIDAALKMAKRRSKDGNRHYVGVFLPGNIYRLYVTVALPGSRRANPAEALEDFSRCMDRLDCRMKPIVTSRSWAVACRDGFAAPSKSVRLPVCLKQKAQRGIEALVAKGALVFKDMALSGERTRTVRLPPHFGAVESEALVSELFLQGKNEGFLKKEISDLEAGKPPRPVRRRRTPAEIARAMRC